MTAESVSRVFPYLRSCKQETETAIDGQVTGEIPIWLEGSLIRNGPGTIEVGPDRYNHLFDGLAMMHRFAFEKGRVTYQNRFLRSDTYRKNMEANKIVVSEFGTKRIPDPCRTIFQRLSSVFERPESTDNDLVTIVSYSDEVYACSETNKIWRIDPLTLKTIQKVHLNKYIPIEMALAHTHEDKDGTVYNIGSTPGFTWQYCILKFPPKEHENDRPFEKASVICRIPSSKYLSMSYHHSFAMTENYFVFVEQPLYITIPGMMWSKFKGESFGDALQWDASRPNRFHVVRRSDNKLLDTVYLSDSFSVFHHINAYDDQDHLVVDLCSIKQGDLVKTLYIKALELQFDQPRTEESLSKAMRYVLPLNVDRKNKVEDNLVTLQETEAKAYQQTDGSIYCTPETLPGSEFHPELPRINYENFNGKKYQYFYAIAQTNTLLFNQLLKLDVINKTTLAWNEEGAIPSEPIFISKPGADVQNEDEGVILASLLYKDDDRKVSLLVLNAKNMKEVGRATFITPSQVPADFHGAFIAKV